MNTPEGAEYREKSAEELIDDLMAVIKKKSEAEKDFQMRVMFPLEKEEAIIENKLFKEGRIVYLSPEPGEKDLTKLGIRTTEKTMDTDQVQERLKEEGYICLRSRETSSTWLKKR